ncbi:MAG TPA: response regulator transcription factor [Phycisphaerae bacterium]|nr:response regulator transcription factor [Phycisphaerae bacterium]
MATEEIKVFLADDHTVVRQALAEMIAREPDFAVVGQCGEGLQVIPQVLETKPDVLILDIAMPGLNGLDVCRQVTRKVKSLAVLVLSMYDDEEFIARALENGACGYLMKEADHDQLLNALRAVSRGELYLAQGISRTILQRLGGGGEDPYESLTMRERQVFQLIAEGKTNREVAKALGLAIKTVDTHRTRLMRKLDIHDRTALVKYALRKGIVSLR